MQIKEKMETVITLPMETTTTQKKRNKLKLLHYFEYKLF